MPVHSATTCIMSSSSMTTRCSSRVFFHVSVSLLLLGAELLFLVAELGGLLEVLLGDGLLLLGADASISLREVSISGGRLRVVRCGRASRPRP
jgi:hypothetical protein